MSIRVHELARELGVKSKDLLDAIKELGVLDNPSTFSGLQPDAADRIRGRFKGSSVDSSPAVTRPAHAADPTEIKKAPAATTRPTSSPAETPAIRPSASGPPNQNAGSAPTPPPTAGETPSRPTASPPAGESTKPTPTPPAATATPTPTPAPAPTPAAPPVTPPAAQASAPVEASAPPARPAVNPAPSGPQNAPAAPRPGTAPGATAPAPSMTGAPASAAPRPAASGLSSPPRSGVGGGSGGGGPLSRHTHHRGTGAPPAQGGQAPQQGQGPPPGPRPQPPQGQQGGPVRPQGQGQQPNAPLQRSDYISPTGTRAPIGRPQQLGPAPQQPRRPDGPDQDGGRPRPDRDMGPRRPLPSVASPSMPPPGPRRPEQRPQQGGPELKTQRPEVKYTREQLLQMRQTGEIGGGGAPVAPSRPGAPGGPRPATPSRFPSQPAGGSGPRPPMPGPGGAPPIRRAGAPLAPPVAPPPIAPTDEEEDRKGKGRIGSPGDRAARRAKRDQKANDRRVTSPMPASALISDDDDGGKLRIRKGIHKGGHRPNQGPQRKTHAEIEPPISVRTLSEAIGIKAADLIRKLMTNFNQLVTINANLDEESAQMLALEYGVELQIVRERTAEDELLEAFETTDEADENLTARPPVVTILGHVDHGKTSLLDRIRRSNVVDSESGGITQHIGAYQVEKDGKAITFVDTPGHEAFTEMRARGANVTDIVILVVAADDGVMPQTVEAISHAKAAEVPIIVALNKIDLPNVNINKIYGELSQHELVPEEYGGDTPVIKTSAISGLGIDDLLEMIGIVAELKCDLRANATKNATGTCLEALVSEGRGAIARVIVQDGTLHVGDVMVCGDGFGRVRALFNDKGRAIESAGPSTPVEVSGLDAVPTAGEKFGVIEDITRAREIAETRRERTRGVNLGDRQSITLENLFDKMTEKKVKSLNLILKADVQGSLEALTKELEKLVNPEVPIRVLHKAVGGISESDILLADASQAIVIGFRVAPEDRAVTLAEEKKIDIRRYDIIYQVTDEIKKAVEGMLVPEIKEVHLGRAVVRQLFKISKIGTVAGCFVTQGLIERSAKARVLRDGREIYKGGIEALKRFKDDVKEVRENFECGIKITNFDDLKSDDVIEAYRIDVIRRTL